MAHSFISRMRVRPEREAEFVALCREMEAGVAAHEPHVLYYKFYRLAEPHMFAVIESFPDEAADLAHQEMDYARPIIARMIPCLDGGYHRDYLLPLE